MVCTLILKGKKVKLSILVALLCSLSFANDYYKEEKGKIDMHGGKGDKLLGNSSHFSNQKELNSLQDLTIKKPTEPSKPKQPIITQEK